MFLAAVFGHMQWDSQARDGDLDSLTRNALGGHGA